MVAVGLFSLHRVQRADAHSPAGSHGIPTCLNRQNGWIWDPMFETCSLPEP